MAYLQATSSAGSLHYAGVLSYSGDKDGWRRFIEPSTTAAGDAMDKIGGTWDYSCTICGQQNTRGIADHIPSAKHWKTLGNKLNWTAPSPEQATAMCGEYVQRINTPKRGVFLFNHVTGAHCFEDELAGLGAAMVSTPAVAQPAQPEFSIPDSVAIATVAQARFLAEEQARQAAEEQQQLINIQAAQLAAVAAAPLQQDATAAGKGQDMSGYGGMMDAWGGGCSPCGMWGKGDAWGMGGMCNQQGTWGKAGGGGMGDGAWCGDAWGGDAWGKGGCKGGFSPYGGGKW